MGFRSHIAIISPPGRDFRLCAAGVALQHRCGYISAPISHYVSSVVRGLAGGGPELDGRYGVREKCR